MKHIITTLTVVASSLFFSSCGSVSKVELSPAVIGGSYTKVVVKDFAYKAKLAEASGPASSTIFSSNIADEINKKGVMSATRNGKVGKDCLVISGDITRFEEGNSAVRMLVGMGAGSSYFDADIRFTDGVTGKNLGTMKADKNSWGLGGGLAAGQAPSVFMREAAKKVAIESLKFSKNVSNNVAQ